jgi:tetratricopeptide (TPR) repeat protein
VTPESLSELVDRSYTRRRSLPSQARVAITVAMSRLAGPEARIIGDELEELGGEVGESAANREAQVRLALFGVERGELEANEALRWARFAVEADPQNSRLRVLLADALEAAGDELAALGLLTRFIEDPRYESDFGLHFRVGVLSYNLKQFEKAAAAYQRAAEIRPTARTHLYLADALRALDSREAARYHYREALRRDQMLVDALRGYWALGSEGELRESWFDAISRRLLEAPVKPLPLNRWLRPVLWRVLKWRLWSHPEDARLHFMLGYCALLRRDYEFAHERLTFAYLLPHARDYEALVLAALSLGLGGHPDDADSMLEEALSAGVSGKRDVYGRELRSEDMFSRLMSPFFWEPMLQWEPGAEQATKVVLTRVFPLDPDGSW